MHRRTPLLAALISLACDAAPAAKDASAAKDAPAVKDAPPAVTQGPPRLVLDAQGLLLGEQRVAIPASSVQVRAELVKALTAHRSARPPSTTGWIVEVAPDAPARVWTDLVDAAGTAGVTLRFVDVGATAELALAARAAPPAGTTTCSETGVAIGRGLTWVGRFEMTVDEHGVRRAVKDDPELGLVPFVHGGDTDVCRRLGGPPERLDLAALAAAVAAMRPALTACGPLRVAVHGQIEWRRAAPVLRALGQPGHGLVLVDPVPSLFAGCGSNVFTTPVFPLGMSDRQGPLDDSAIQQVLANHGDEADTCMALEPPRDPNSGPPSHAIEVEVGPTGAVTAARPRDRNDPVSTCLASAATAWKFPEPRAPQPVKLTLDY